MAAWMRTLWIRRSSGTEAFTGLRDRRDAFMQGFFVIVIVALLIGLPTLVGHLAKVPPPERHRGRSWFQAMSRMARSSSSCGQFMGNCLQAQWRRSWSRSKRTSRRRLRRSPEIEASADASCRSRSATCSSKFGDWVSQPFSAAGFPLARGGAGHLAGLRHLGDALAKLLGGRGTLAGFFGSTALFAVPHLLDFFALGARSSAAFLGLRRLLLGPGDLRQGHRQQPPDDAGTRVAGSGSAGVARAAARLHRRDGLGGDSGDQHVRRPLSVTSDA